MRPVPIPDELVWEGAARKIIAGPDGDLTGDIRPVEALIDNGQFGRRILIRVALEPGDLGRLGQDPHFWLIFHAEHLHPFSVELPEPPHPGGGSE